MTGAKYERLAAELRGRVVAGKLKPGERFPSRSELVAEGHGERTVHEALRVLRAEGWIVATPGAGTFVADPLPEQGASDSDRLSALEQEVALLRAELDDLKREHRQA